MPLGGGATDTRAPQSRASQGPFRRRKRKRPEARGSFRPYLWCPGPESNRHALRLGILSPLRLPISPPWRVICEDANYGTVVTMNYQTIEQAVGNTPLVSLQRIAAQENATRGNAE